MVAKIKTFAVRSYAIVDVTEPIYGRYEILNTVSIQRYEVVLSHNNYEPFRQNNNIQITDGKLIDFVGTPNAN